MDADTARKLFAERKCAPPKDFNEVVQRMIKSGRRRFCISMTPDQAEGVKQLGYDVTPNTDTTIVGMTHWVSF